MKPNFIEDKIFLDLRNDYYGGLVRITALVHELSQFRVSSALRDSTPNNLVAARQTLRAIGFEPVIVLGADDYAEILRCGGRIDGGYASFVPNQRRNVSVSGCWRASGRRPQHAKKISSRRRQSVWAKD